MRTLKAAKIITGLLFALTTSFAYSQFRTPPVGPFIPVGDQWVISEKSKVGARSRVQSRDQNPYPFCFSFAATALFDQQRCITSKTDCSKQERSSSLAVSGAGQDLPQGEVNITKGGVGSQSLQQLLIGGHVPDSLCNYNIHDPKDPEYQTQLGNQLSASGSLKFYREGWQKYQEYTPYLERFYRTQFTNSIRKMNPSVNEEEILHFLKTQKSDTQLWGSLLLKPACFKDAKVEDNYNIKTSIVDTAEERRKAYLTINKLIEKNIPVFTGICVGNLFENKCDSSLHAVVIVAKGTAYSKLTGDKRTVYWIVNTWGEHWQEKNADGWIFAESFIERVIGEIVWLESK